MTFRNKDKEKILRRLAIFQSQVGQFTRATVIGLYAKEDILEQAQFRTAKDELQDIYVQWKELIMDLGFTEEEITTLAYPRYEHEVLEHDKDESTISSNFIKRTSSEKIVYHSTMAHFRDNNENDDWTERGQ